MLYCGIPYLEHAIDKLSRKLWRESGFLLKFKKAALILNSILKNDFWKLTIFWGVQSPQ